MAVQNLQQERAAYALQQVQQKAEAFAADREPRDWKTKRKKFMSRASELPFMIHANGLGQALAFFKSKGAKDGYDHLFAILSGWLIKKDRPLAGQPDALTGITKCDRAAYLAAQAEAILLMDWVKKFAVAFMEVPKDASTNASTNIATSVNALQNETVAGEGE